MHMVHLFFPESIVYGHGDLKYEIVFNLINSQPNDTLLQA